MTGTACVGQSQHLGPAAAQSVATRHSAGELPAPSSPPVLAPGLFCVRGRASLDKLAALGRPVLLRLHNREGGESVS